MAKSRRSVKRKRSRRSKSRRSFGIDKNRDKNRGRKRRRSYSTVNGILGLMALASLGYVGKQGYDWYQKEYRKVSPKKAPLLLTAPPLPPPVLPSPSLEPIILPPPPPPPPPPTVIEKKWELPVIDYKRTYLEVMPDVEGCWSKVVDFMSRSDIFTINGQPPTAENLRPENFNDPKYNALEMKWGTKFVCLGDTIDNGPNNVAILRLLKYLRTKYCTILGGCSIIFILGNRDINKLRLLYELYTNIPRKDVDRLLKPGVDFPTDYGRQTTVERFKWLLDKTMAAPTALKDFQEEMGIQSEEEAVKSYMKIMLGDDGLLKYYLTNGNFLHYDAKTKSLFTHGGINCSNFKKLYASIYDNDDRSGNSFRTIWEWERYTNMFLQNALVNIYETDRSTRSRESMLNDEAKLENFFRYMDEQMLKQARRSVIISRPWKSTETATAKELEVGIGTSIIDEGCFDEIVKDIKFIFNGHTPVGQIPVIMRSQKDNKEIIFIFCDTTLAGRIGNVKIVQDGLNFEVAIKARYIKEQTELKDACKKSKYTNFDELEYSTKDPIIGTLTNEDKEYVIAQIGEDTYLTGKWKLTYANSKYPDVPSYIAVNYGKTVVLV